MPYQRWKPLFNEEPDESCAPKVETPCFTEEKLTYRGREFVIPVRQIRTEDGFCSNCKIALRGPTNTKLCSVCEGLLHPLFTNIYWKNLSAEHTRRFNSLKSGGDYLDGRR